MTVMERCHGAIVPGWRRIAVLGAALLALAPTPAAAQKTHLTVIVGLAGEPEHGEAFNRWATTLVDAAGRLGVAKDNLVFLTEKPDADPTRASGRSTKEEVAKALGKVAASAAEDDVVFVVLIGHGTFDGKQARFNLPGPDMTPADFEPLLKPIKSRHVVFINTASASGPFMETLAGQGRTIVTATRSGSERFATLFGGYFVDALAGSEADADRNKRVSVLEAFSWAKREVANAYEREGIMRTENALLNDSGGEGSPDPSPEGKQGRNAAVISLGTTESAEPLPDDPKLRQLYEERRDIERRVEALKLMKGGMPADRYTTELEKLLTDLALKTRQIREIEKKLPEALEGSRAEARPPTLRLAQGRPEPRRGTRAGERGWGPASGK